MVSELLTESHFILLCSFHADLQQLITIRLPLLAAELQQAPLKLIKTPLKMWPAAVMPVNRHFQGPSQLEERPIKSFNPVFFFFFARLHKFKSKLDSLQILLLRNRNCIAHLYP